MGDTESEPDIFYNWKRPQVETLGHELRNKTLDLTFALPAECSGKGAECSTKTRADAEPQSQTVSGARRALQESGGRIKGMREVRDPTRTRPTESIDWDSWGLSEVREFVGI